MVVGTLRVDLYFLISYNFICKDFRIIILSLFVFIFHMCFFFQLDFLLMIYVFALSQKRPE
jgi:hypothetical protein